MTSFTKEMCCNQRRAIARPCTLYPGLLYLSPPIAAPALVNIDAKVIDPCKCTQCRHNYWKGF